jgi:hypothetical protein
MPSYTITVVNERFTQEGQHEAADNIAAWKEAISSAIGIAGEQVSHGNPFLGAEVTLAQGARTAWAVCRLGGRYAAEGLAAVRSPPPAVARGGGSST